MGWVTTLLDQLEVGAPARASLWGGTAAAWLGLQRATEAESTDGDESGAPLRPRLLDVCC
jgi:hypothetical protein